MDKFLHFLVVMLVAFAGGLLTTLFGNEAADCLVGIGGTIFAGLWSGLAAMLGYQFGNDGGWKKEEVIPELIGVVVGCAAATMIFAFPG